MPDMPSLSDEMDGTLGTSAGPSPVAASAGVGPIAPPSVAAGPSNLNPGPAAATAPSNHHNPAGPLPPIHQLFRPLATQGPPRTRIYYDRYRIRQDIDNNADFYLHNRNYDYIPRVPTFDIQKYGHLLRLGDNTSNDDILNGEIRRNPNLNHHPIHIQNRSHANRNSPLPQDLEADRLLLEDLVNHLHSPSPPPARPGQLRPNNPNSARAEPTLAPLLLSAYRLPENGSDRVNAIKEETEDQQEHALLDLSAESLQADSMPATSTRKRTRATTSIEPSASTSSKRRRVGEASTMSTATAAKRKRSGLAAEVESARGEAHHDLLFGSEPDEDDVDGVEVVDLSKGDEIPKEMLEPKVDKSVKLAAFECIICMDSATDLTVTSCGHLFCGQCLHQAMSAEVTKKMCPMCRQKLEMPRSNNGRAPSRNQKTFFHLELKLMPSARRGKRPAGSG